MQVVKQVLSAPRQTWMSITLIVASVISVSTAHADNWPTRPVKMLVISSPGGAPDIMTRLIAEQLSRRFGKNFYVENSVGAGGIAAMRALKTTAADGYTFALVPASTVVIAPHVFKDLPYDIDADFVPVAFVGASPIAIAVRSDSTYATFADFLSALKTQPLAVGTTITNSLPNLLGTLTRVKANADFTIVPFSASTQGITALLRGDVAAMIDGYPAFEGMLQDGQVKVLASFDDSRSDITRGQPVVAESIPGAVATGWFAIFARKDTPEAITAQFKLGVDEALVKPELVEKMRAMTVVPQPMPTAKLLQFIAKEKSFWAEAVERAAAKPH